MARRNKRQRPTRDVEVYWGEPSEPQQRFLDAKPKNVGYGGARGGGKSWVVRIKAIMLALAYPGIKILIVRRTFPELEANHLGPLREMLLPLKIGVKYNAQRREFRFANGATIKGGYCNNDNDLMQYQGTEYDVEFLEEVTNLRPEWIEKIIVCCRGANTLPKHVYWTCNPGGPGHSLVKRLFVDRVYQGAEKPEDYEFIPARVTDNKALMTLQPDYYDTLNALNPKLRKMWLDGSWDVLEGQVFEEFRDNPEGYVTRRWSHVISAFEPDPGWQIYRAYDHGYNKPFSLAWYAIDYDGVIYRILEMYGCRENEPDQGVHWTADRIFAEAQKVELQHPWLRGKKILGVADPSIWRADGGVSVAETAGQYGIYFQPGDNERIAGWMQCHYRLQFDEAGYSRFYVMKETNPGFIRTIPLLEYDPVKPEDVNTKQEDHIADEWRYLMQSRPVQPILPEAEPVYAPLMDPLNQLTRTRYGQTRFG